MNQQHRATAGDWMRDPVFLTTIFTLVGIIIIHLIPAPERAEVPSPTIQALASVVAPADSNDR
jgi:hypothetical protein